MPRVPTQDAFAVQQAGISASPIASPQVDNFGPRQSAQMGAALQSAGGELQRIQLDVANQANQVRLNDAMNKAVEARLRLTFDKDAGYQNLRGDAALTRPGGKALDAEYGEKFDDAIRSIESTLGNDAQKQAFQLHAQKLRSQFGADLNQHVAKEFNEYQSSVADGTVKVSRDQMALDPFNPEAVGQSVRAIKAAVAEQGRLRGWSGQQTVAATIEALSPGHASVMAAAIDGGKLNFAREYMKQNNAELTPQARLQLTRTLDAGEFEAKTQTATESLLAEAGGDAQKALQLARQKHSGKEEDAIVTRIKALDGERVALRERGQKDAGDQAWRIYATTGSLGKIPPTVLAAMDGRDLESLRRAARADAEARQQRSEVKTDPSVYYALSMAAATDTNNFQKEDLRGYFDRLSPGDRKHFIDLQSSILKPGKDNVEVVGVGQQISAMVKTLKLKDEKAGTFMMEANAALFRAQQAAGKPLTQDQRQAELDRLVVEGTVPGTFFGTSSRRAYEASAEGKPFTPTYSDADKRKAEAALKRQGIANPTQKQIEDTLKAVYQ